jgi:hypothetical protein
MENDVLHVLKYFTIFSYAPTFEELHTFLSKKTTKKELHAFLKKSKKVIKRNDRYTIQGYGQHIDLTAKKGNPSMCKIKRLQHVIHILKIIPFIQFIGLTGSVAMSNAEVDDDIDLCIITTQNRMWITRFFSLLILQLLGIRRKRGVRTAKDKMCLNLFFDEQDLTLPLTKQTEYGGHEILQMKPLVNKKNAYEKFLSANAWVVEMFPNASKNYIKTYKIDKKTNNFLQFPLMIITNLIEHAVKRFQMNLIRKHKTKERITSTQLWFFPYDYEDKVKKKLTSDKNHVQNKK